MRRDDEGVLVKVSASFPSVNIACAGYAFYGVRAEEGSLVMGCENSGCAERTSSGREERCCARERRKVNAATIASAKRFRLRQLTLKYGDRAFECLW